MKVAFHLSMFSFLGSKKDGKGRGGSFLAQRNATGGPP